MPGLFDFKWLINLVFGEADSSNSPESPLRPDGAIIDGQNMRPTPLDGNASSRENIKGEIIQYDNVDNRCFGGTGLPLPDSYRCIGSIQVLNHKVEFWADEFNLLVPYVRVDGWIVLYPNALSFFPILNSFPPQLDGNDSCVGGEVFYTDNNIPPFILNVTDLLKNSGINPANNLRDGTYPCTEKYFSSFNVQDYQIQPPTQQDHPQFIEIIPTGSTPNSICTVISRGTGGMKVGVYQYAIQYVDSTGNVTNWSEMTPQIPVPYNLTYNEPVFPSTHVYGDSPATTSLSGIHIRFRITNTQNYTSINVRRISWDAGAALNTPANDDSVIYTTATGFLTNGQISIVDFYDNDNATQSPVTISASTQSNLSAIQAAKGIRYYNSKLTLWNITYASRNIQNLVFNTSNGTMYPFVRPLGVQGYKDIWNDVYRKSYFRGEKYGFALVGFDNTGNPSFAVPIPGSNPNFGSQPFTNFQMPNRRDQLTGPSLTASTEVVNSSANIQPLTSAVNSSGAVSQTYEVFDNVGMVQRDPLNTSAAISSSPVTIIDDSGTFGVPDKSSGQNPNGYNPFRPVKDSDSSNNFDYLPTVAVNDGSVSDPTIQFSQAYGSNGMYSGFLPYNPKGFLPNLYALGMVIDGVSNLPSWCSAFAIVRTAPANRILAQGQGYYNFNVGNTSPPAWTNNNIGKDQTGMIWDSPDFYTGISPVNNIISNLSRYKAQFVSPLGIFTEVFSGYTTNSYVVSTVSVPSVSLSYDREIDMISYARILTDGTTTAGSNYEINPIYSGGGPTMAGVTDANGRNFTAWNSWRNTASTGALTPVTPNEEFGINYLNQNFSTGYSVTAGSSPRRSVYYLQTTGTVYATGYTGGSPNGIDYYQPNVRNWHEPFFVVNIVDDTQNVSNSLVNDYFQTGTFIKTSSIIGQILSTAVNPSFYLVDERWQDCIPAERSTDPLAGQDRYVWIQDANNNVFAWINVTYKTSAQVAAIQSAIATNGFYVSTKCDGSHVQCYGMYSHKITTYTNGNLTSAGEKFYQVVFDQKTSTGGAMLPAPLSYVLVKYDTCAPIEIFGGDAFIGEYTYPVADCSYDSSANPSQTADKFIIDRPLPYRAYEANENTLIIHDNDPILGSLSIQGNNLIRHFKTVSGFNESSYVRQLLVNGIIESRTNTALFHDGNGNDYVGSYYPNINYILRPIQWRTGHTHTNIQGQYFTDFGNEDTNWAWGGFRINPQDNIDYSEIPTADKSYSMPSSGFTEKLNFCSRVQWSDTRSTSEENSPNLRNFPTTNIYDFDDATGGFNRAWDSSNAGQQGNLYGFTEKGTVMAETNKSILTSISGGQLAEIGNSNDSFIQAEVWLSRNIGMPDQLWRTAAEFSNKIYWADKRSVYMLENNRINDIGEEQRKYANTIQNALASIAPGYGSDVTALWNEKYKEYWLCVNSHRQIIGYPLGGTPVPTVVTIVSYPIAALPPSRYIVTQDSYIDLQNLSPSGFNTISITGVNPLYVTEFYINVSVNSVSVFYNPSNPSAQIGLPVGTYRAFWNPSLNEWQFDQNMINLCNDLIWSEDLENEQGMGWLGQYKYRFDKYVMDESGNVYGSRNNQTWLLDSGYHMNGAPVDSWLLQSAVPKDNFQFNSEFVRIRVNSNHIPDSVLFYSTIEDYYSGNLWCSIIGSNPFALKNYGGVRAPSWEGYVPRGNAANNFYRLQGRYMIYQVKYQQNNSWWVSSVGVQHKPLM